MVHNNRHRYIYSVYISKETIQDYIGDGEDEVGTSGSGRAEIWLTDQVDNRRLLKEASVMSVDVVPHGRHSAHLQDVLNGCPLPCRRGAADVDC